MKIYILNLILSTKYHLRSLIKCMSLAHYDYILSCVIHIVYNNIYIHENLKSS